MRKIHILLWFVLAVSILFAYFFPISKYTVPNPPVPVIGDINDFSKPTPDRSPDYNPVLVNTDLVTIIRSDNGIKITNNSEYPLGYEVFATEIVDNIEWVPCDSIEGCPEIHSGETLDMPLAGFPDGDTATIFWWERTIIPHLEKNVNGDIHSQEIAIH